MYTQCPECGTSFHVTAEVLKQAIGKVRCGGCGVAFNALEYLSEQKPTSELIRDTDAQLPELTPKKRPAAPAAEMRFDDNTPVPDDFDVDDELAATDVLADDAGAREEPAQVDLALGDPEEWEELLDEVDGAQVAAAESAPAEIDEALP
ncbi:MAG: zinc-ribbon domain-containing protein, partial [Proteobacteria bacterium]|nr:zinc-ribbon domain-containing protein [Pseudomonadota bacterium]